MPEQQEIGVGGINVRPGRLRALRPEVVAQLAESISVDGLLHAIIVRPRGEHGYWLVAGRHRFEAVRQLKWDAIPAVVAEELDADAAEKIEIIENLVRADLSPAERALHIGRLKEFYEKEHPETKRGAAGRAAIKVKGGPAPNSQNASKASVPSFIVDTASKTGKHFTTIARDTARAENVTVLGQIAGTCLDKRDEIDALAKLPADEQQTLAKAAKKGKKVSAKTRVKQVKRDARETDLGTKQAALPQQKFGVVVADPEWRFEPWSRQTGMDRAADNHYPTNCTEVIAARDVPSISAPDCVLFLWATAPMLPHALLVMAAWGFDYVSNYVWDKQRTGTGYWSRNAHEHLLIGTKGNIPCPAPGTQWPSLIEAPVGKHSEKPDRFLEMIEQYFPTLPKIELNRRGAARDGWAAWGNEAEQLEAAE